MKKNPLVKVFEKYIQWKSLPEDERGKKQGFADANGIHLQTLYNWDKKMGKMEVGEVDAFLEHVRKMAVKPGAMVRWAELYAKMKGLLVEKSEQKVIYEVSAGERARAINKADRELREMGYGVEQMPSELPLLPKELRQN